MNQKQFTQIFQERGSLSILNLIFLLNHHEPGQEMTQIGKSLTNVPWQMLQGQRTLLLMDFILMLQLFKKYVVEKKQLSLGSDAKIL